MSAQEMELKETNSTPVATAKLEPDDNQKKQGLRRILNEHPMGARAAAFLLLDRKSVV